MLRPTQASIVLRKGFLLAVLVFSAPVVTAPKPAEKVKQGAVSGWNRRQSVKYCRRLLSKIMDAELIKYLIEWMPDALIDCAGCTRQIEISKAVQRENKFYHSEQCADIATAVMIKPKQPQTIYEGWAI